MLELVNGRPVTNEGRLEKEIRCYDLLDSLNVAAASAVAFWQLRNKE